MVGNGAAWVSSGGQNTTAQAEGLPLQALVPHGSGDWKDRIREPARGQVLGEGPPPGLPSLAVSSLVGQGVGW